MLCLFASFPDFEEIRPFVVSFSKTIICDKDEIINDTDNHLKAISTELYLKIKTEIKKVKKKWINHKMCWKRILSTPRYVNALVNIWNVVKIIDESAIIEDKYSTLHEEKSFLKNNKTI